MTPEDVRILLRFMGMLEHAGLDDADRCFPDSEEPHRPAPDTLPRIEHACEDAEMLSIERAPKHCSNGHALGPNQVIVGWTPCPCTTGAMGHRTYQCRECDVVIEHPPHVGPQWFGVQWGG